ncbi:hypothetical protein SEA_CHISANAKITSUNE_16 [Gordonia phage ChisanaKitsune]|uniref:Uncharacterized protein n=1 Tax=Gordonia phage ChisanaKitsune TaxID=2871538 RepID=A0AAE7XF79_9CAUD|nr:hypothetical protein PQD15_gp016 [Gordonia phage ChisanaKitsune]QZE10787.1 hypothetical protein SEA_CHISANAKITSUNE_16 [Gordonia phage ChisanaKitsune]
MTDEQIEYTYNISVKPGEQIDPPRFGVVVDFVTNEETGEAELRIRSNLLSVQDTERGLATAMEIMDDFWQHDEQAVPEDRDENLAAHAWRPWPEENGV